MKTTKRSKMLLSSVAMLLVALVALGSATFAWYAVNRQVTATDISVSAAAPGGLAIGKATNPTAKTVSYSTEFTDIVLTPAKINTWTSDVPAMKTGYSDSESTGAINSTGLVDPVAGATYVVYADMYVKNNGSTTVTVTPAISATQTAGTFIDFALYDADNDALNAEASSYATGSTKTNAADAFDLAAGAEKHFVFAVYADGENDQCTTNDAVTTPVAWSVVFNSVDKAA